MPNVILVDAQDHVLGEMEKQLAHQQGALHRAFSVFLFRHVPKAGQPQTQQIELLLQRRAENKYHSGGLWANACCSHPAPGEETLAAAARRLKEELDLENIPLQELFCFTYQAAFENGLQEHEFDHVLLGACQETPLANPEEVAELRWVPLLQLEKALAEQPQQFAIWFKLAAPTVLKWLFAQEA